MYAESLTCQVKASVHVQWNPALRTPAYNGQFCLSPQKAHIFPLKLTHFIRTLLKMDNRHFSVSRVINSHKIIVKPALRTLVICMRSIFFVTRDSDGDILEVNAASKEPEVKSLKEAMVIDPGGHD